MAGGPIRLNKVARELNVGLNTIVEFLGKKGVKIEGNAGNAKIDEDTYGLIVTEFQGEKTAKEKQRVTLPREKKETITLENTVQRPANVKEDTEAEEILIKNLQSKPELIKPKVEQDVKVKVMGKIDLGEKKTKKETSKKAEEPKKEKPVEKEVKPNEPVTPEVIETIKADVEKLSGPKVMGKIDLPVSKEKKSAERELRDYNDELKKKRKRKRVKKVDVERTAANFQTEKKFKPKTGGGARKDDKAEVTEEEIRKEIKETLARLSEQGGKSKSSKLRKAKREMLSQKREEERILEEEEKKVLKLTEFVTVSDLASMMNVSATEVIGACMSLGIFASINQRIDAETIAIIAEEFGYKVEFVSAEIQETEEEEKDDPEDLQTRPPIVTVMGHVDHGKTSLLDYIRKANVIAGEAGGITQHIGAYSVQLENGRRITFLDTPGHEAFTAMRARGAKVTDIAIIVIAADDAIMPQTTEAINHARAAGVPMIFAINKIDKDGANPDKIREQLAAMDLLVEEWGGKYQCQEISAKKGLNINTLLEKVLLEADLLDLKANPDKLATGTIIEATLDKGRGYVTTILVNGGTLHKGDVMLAGCFTGRVKAMFNERGAEIKEADPATPVIVLGLDGAPNAGDSFKVMEDEKEARSIAMKRLQLQREQQLRTHKHITLDEIGRRLAIGDFQELNLIVKGDVDGSVEALSDSLLKLSTDKVQIKVIHKGVGAITDSDVLLASASNAIIIGFQVRPSASARKLAEVEEIDIRLYSVIYKAIDEVKDAMAGMLTPEKQEKIMGSAEIRQAFKISKVGTVAGCYVLDGKITRSANIRIIREGIVIHTGKLGSLKRFKDDQREVSAGYECGLNIDRFNDIKEGDIIEAFEEVEVKATL
jgi:translation initiation factor IF-2